MSGNPQQARTPAVSFFVFFLNIKKKVKYFHPGAWDPQMRVPYCLSRPCALGIANGPTPVTVSVTGAERDVSENRISKVF